MYADIPSLQFAMRCNRWHFAGNATTFQARFLRSAAYNASMAPGGSYPNLKTVGPLDPCYTTFEKMTSLFNVNDNAGVNVMQLPDGRIYAVTDNNPSMEFDSATLDTKGKLQYDDKLEDPLVHSLTSAHPVEVPDSSGDMVNYLVNIMDGFIELQRFKLQLYRVNTDLKRRVIAEVTHTHLPYVHSFSVTENYAILAAYPLFMEGATVSDLPPIGAVFPSLKWHGDKANATLYVFSLDDDGQTKPLATYEAPPLFSYHHINAYEDSDGSIVMDLCGYPDAQVLSATGGFGYIGTLQDPEARQKLKVDATIYRYRLPKPSRSGSRERQLGGAVDGFVVPAFVKGIDPAGGVNSIELPRINERLRGRKYCFAYGLSAALNAQNTWDAWRLIKTDMCSIQGGGAHPSDQVAKATVWTEPNQFVTEPIFVERPGASREDDGVLLSHVLDASKPPPLASSYMLILNATDMTVLAKLPNPDGHHEPFSFHGLFDGRF